MKEIFRQLVHLVFGLGFALFILIFNREASLALLGIAIFVGVLLSDAIARGYYIPLVSWIVGLLERKEAVPGKGALFFLVSALFCVIFFDPVIVFLSLIVLSFLDSAATICGLRFGRHQIIHGRTLEGSICGIGVATIALLPFIQFPLALLTAGIAGIVELFSPVDDNLVIPVTVCILLTLAG